MDLTPAQSLTFISIGASAWLMIRAGSAKRALRIKRADRCAWCGRERGRGRCPCLTRN
jgi:hypothetical protein